MSEEEGQEISSTFPFMDEMGVWRQALNQRNFDLLLLIFVNVVLLVVYIVMSYRTVSSTIWIDGDNYPGYNGEARLEWPQGRFNFKKSILDK